MTLGQDIDGATVGERIREERERLGFSLPAMAIRSGLGKPTLTRLEGSGTVPEPRALLALGKVHVDILFVVFGERNPDATLPQAFAEILCRQALEQLSLLDRAMLLHKLGQQAVSLADRMRAEQNP